MARMSDDTEPDPIVTRSISISEVMDGDGDRMLTFDIADLETWDIIGFLESALVWFRQDLAYVWSETADDD